MLAPSKMLRACAQRAASVAQTAKSARSFSLLVNEEASQSSLVEEFPGVPAPTGSRPAPTDVQVTELSNGLRVVSQDLSGGVASVGVYVKAGSRRDAAGASGTAHLLEHLAFKASLKRSGLKFQRDVESFGAAFEAKATRESLAYTGTALRDYANDIVANLAETITQPNLATWVVSEEKSEFSRNVNLLQSDASVVLMERLHTAAFGGSPLGRGLYATQQSLAGIDADTIRAYLGNNFTANNMVLSGSNIDHETLVAMAKTYFPAIPEGTIEAQEKAEYVGGEQGLRTESGAAHVAVGFKAPSLNDKDLYALGVLQALLGSADSAYESRLSAFAAEKGDFIQQAAAFALPYSDVGLVGVAGSVADHDATRLVDAFGAVLKGAASKVDAEELRRAKNQLKTRVAADLELPANVREELGTSLLLQGKFTTYQEVAAAIDAVDAAAVQSVAAGALKSHPAVSTIGSLSNLPRYDTLASKFN